MTQSAFPPDLTSGGRQRSNKLIKFICFHHTLERHQGSMRGPIDFKYYVIKTHYNEFHLSECDSVGLKYFRSFIFTNHSTVLITQSCEVVFQCFVWQLCILLLQSPPESTVWGNKWCSHYVNNFPRFYLSPGIMTGKKCLLIRKLKWEYPFLGRHQSFTEQNTVAGSFPKINSLLASTIKGQQTIVHALRCGNRWLHLMHFHLSAWHRVFTKAAFSHMVAICKDISN